MSLTIRMKKETYLTNSRHHTLISSSSDVVSFGHVARFAKSFCKKLNAFSFLIENFFCLNRAEGAG